MTVCDWVHNKGNTHNHVKRGMLAFVTVVACKGQPDTSIVRSARMLNSMLPRSTQHVRQTYTS
eukprot:3087892-Amphidinium_carterae.1